MEFSKSQAWVTSVMTEESVEGALVLAESLRRSMTTKCIVAITSNVVSLQRRLALRKSFDIVLLLDEMFYVGKCTGSTIGEAQAKAYVFLLTQFEKCVFISHNSMVLENADNLFETKLAFQSRANANDNSSFDLSLFLVQPDYNLWEELCNSHADETSFSDSHLGRWLKNKGSDLKAGVLPINMIADFRLDSGKLQAEQTHAPIIHFVVEENENLSMFEWIKSSRDMEMGLPETRITDIWLEIYRTVTQTNHLNLQRFVKRKSTKTGYRNDPIAIVGMSCRYPGAKNLGEFWNMLKRGEDGIRQPPAFRWTRKHTLGVSQYDGTSEAGFLSVPVDEFDARFFGISPKEAAFMDPQTRLLHEVLWESLEDAAIDPLSLYGTHTGIFTGSWMNDYKDIVAGSADKDFFRMYMGNSMGALAARLSFLLGLTGPSVATESGCSSAIVALDLAVNSLRAGKTNLAMACGVNIILHPFNSKMIEHILSPDGRCKTFDAKANGFARAEGCGVLVLKRLGDALKDRDHIWAVIRGSGISQEGLSKSPGAPTIHCETMAMKLALEDANVTPELVSFVETHGTGTPVGDSIEVAAIGKAYHSRNRKEPLVIGSVKTNVGHTESCSGITGIMKAVLAMQHELIPKHRKLETLNPEIFLDSIPAIIPMENLPWPKVTGNPRMCGVSSFGITGTDGHVILEEAPENELPKFILGLERPTHLMTISAKTSEALDDLLKEYEKRFAGKVGGNDKSEEFANMAYTANVGRAAFNRRNVIVANSVTNAAKMLKEKRLLEGVTKDGQQPKICFLFTGQGSQYQGMAKTLYETSPIFRIHFDNCDKELRTKYGVNIKKVLWESEGDSKELSRTIYSQTSIFCVEYCLLRLWQSWGVQPDYVLGHSLGEFCAAVAAGILDFEDALKLVAERSRLIDSLPRGSMLVIKASKSEVDKLMKEAKVDLDYAAVNNPEQTVVAGDTSTIEQLLAYLKSHHEVKALILEATHAFHSRHMDPMLKQYRKVAETITFKRGNPNNIQYVSGMEGRIIEDASEIMDADYWVRHTREKVNFVDACAALKESGSTDFLEIGPQPVLSSVVMRNYNEGDSLNCLPSLRRGQDDWETILTSLGKLYLLGYSIDWKGYDEPYIRRKVSLPFHPFHRKPFWMEGTQDRDIQIHPLVGYSVKNASGVNIFQNDITLKTVPYLKDHCIGNRVVFPGAGYIEMSLSAAYCTANGFTDTIDQPTRPVRLENMRIHAPLELKEGTSCRFQVIVDLPEKNDNSREEGDPGFRVKLFHQNTINNSEEEEGDEWVLHASSRFIPIASTKKCLSLWNGARISEIMSGSTPMTTDSFYKEMNEQGFKFGESFRSIRRFWANDGTDEVVTEVALPADWNRYLLHPLIIDAVFQSGFLTHESPKLKVPVHIGELTLFSGVNAQAADQGMLYVHGRTENGVRQLFLSNPDLTPIAYMQDLELVDTSVRTIESVLEQQSSAVPEAWEQVWKVIPSPFTASLKLPTTLGLVRGDPYFVSDTQQVEMKCQHRKTNRLVYLYILDALQELGWLPEPNSHVTPNSLQSQLGIQAEFNPLLGFYLKQIEEENEFLVRDKGKTNSWYVARAPPPRVTVKQEMVGLAAALKASPTARSTTLFYENVAQSLHKILRGEVSALQLLFPQEEGKQQYSAETYYSHHPSREKHAQVERNFANALCQTIHDWNKQEPTKVFRMLEVGAGTGLMSGEMLAVLRKVWAERFEYYYTDTSPSFFVKAEKKYQEYRANIKFAVFNVEQSPLSQGIPLEYFDGVCCTNVLHATRSLEESLIHLRQTLKPGGILLFTENIVPSREITYVFGLLPGYWRFEDTQRRTEHCCVSAQVWQDVLQETGFGQVHVETTEIVPMNQFGLIMAIADKEMGIDRLVAPFRAAEQTREWLIFADVADLPGIIVPMARLLHANHWKVRLVLREDESQLAEAAEEDWRPECVRLEEGSENEMKHLLQTTAPIGIIFAWGLNAEETCQLKLALPFLHMAKALLSMSKPPQLFVLTRGVHAVPEDTLTENPSGAMLFGMAKSLKNEAASMLVRCLDLDSRKVSTTEQQLVAQVMYEVAKMPKEAQRLQVAYRESVRYEPRLVKRQPATENVALKLPSITDRYHIKLPESRVIQDLEFEPMEPITLEDDEIEVKVKAFALNFWDVLRILKPIDAFEKGTNVGFEFSGEIINVGSQGSRRWKVGDRVFGHNLKKGQLLASRLTLHWEAVARVPDNLTHDEACTVPTAFFTAYHCLVTLAKMKKEDTVLIHTGAGGVGLAAIQLAKNVGATIITTAGNPRKRAYLQSLGIEHVFHSKNTSFEEDILRVTNGNGVDLVLNSITGPGVKEATLRATAQNGRFIEMSKLSTWTPEEVMELRSDVDYQIVDVSVSVSDQETNTHLLNCMQDYLTSDGFKALPFVRFDARHIRQALLYLQQAKHIGKVVVSMPEMKTTDRGHFQSRVTLFNGESTYLITGGLQGIGFEVCRWMLGKGATDIVLMGRSLPTPEIENHIQQLNDSGFNIVVRLGDVGNFVHCQDTINFISGKMKPLRGVMHCAGVLRDNTLANQTWPDFEATFTPKVHGTWNLHELTKSCLLEHFVVYSSIIALIGSPYQANHAAANCYEDAFIHYRHSLGLPGTTINWGQWAQVGVAKEANVPGLLPVSLQRMLKGLELALMSNKRQICVCKFDSNNKLEMLYPMVKSYLDDSARVDSYSSNGGGQRGNASLDKEQFWRDLDETASLQCKAVIISAYVKMILRTMLAMEADCDMNEDANIQELGVDSLMMIEFKNTIQSLFGHRLKVTNSDLKNGNTIRLLASTFSSKLVDVSDDEDVAVNPLSQPQLEALLNRDVVLPDTIKPNVNAKPPVKPSQIRNILVTGATGQVAPYLIAELSKMYPTIERIYCLVHGTDKDVANARLDSVLDGYGFQEYLDNRIEVVAGNVTEVNIGLDLTTYEHLSHSVDAIIHCAAMTRNFFENLRAIPTKNQTDIRSVNVLGTVNVLRFACDGKVKHIYFPSSIFCGLFHESMDGCLADTVPDTNLIATVLQYPIPGVHITKFICEILLGKATERGIPCKIFRLPWVGGNSLTGQVDPLRNFFIMRYLSYLKLGAMPDIVSPAIVLPVDIIANITLRLFMSDETPNEIFNIAHPLPDVELEFTKKAQQKLGQILDVMSREQLARRMEQQKQQSTDMPAVFDEYHKFMSGIYSDVSVLFRDYVNAPDKFFTNAKVSRFIEKYGEKFPPTMDVVLNNLLYLKKNSLNFNLF